MCLLGKGRVKSFNNISLIIVRKRPHEITLITKQKQICNKGAIVPIGITTIYLHNVEPILINILNKSENATPELFAIYIQNYANQECK